MWILFNRPFRGVVWCSAKKNRWRHKQCLHSATMSHYRFSVRGCFARSTGDYASSRQKRLWTGVCLRQTLLRLETCLTRAKLALRASGGTTDSIHTFVLCSMSRCLLLGSGGLIWPGSWCSEDDPTRMTSSCLACCTMNTMCKCRPHPPSCIALTVVVFIGSGAEIVPLVLIS